MPLIINLMYLNHTWPSNIIQLPHIQIPAVTISSLRIIRQEQVIRENMAQRTLDNVYVHLLNRKLKSIWLTCMKLVRAI